MATTQQQGGRFVGPPSPDPSWSGWRYKPLPRGQIGPPSPRPRIQDPVAVRRARNEYQDALKEAAERMNQEGRSWAGANGENWVDVSGYQLSTPNSAPSQAAYNAWQDNKGQTPTLPTGNDGSGSGSGSGAANAARTAQAILSLLASGAFGYRPDQGLRDQVGKAYQADLASSNVAFDDADASLRSMGPNPFKGMKGSAATIDPEYLNLLASQGANTSLYGAEVEAMNGQNQQEAEGMSAMLRALQGSNDADRQSRRSEMSAARLEAQKRLAEARSGMEMLLNQRDSEGERQARERRLGVVMDLISALGSSGAGIPGDLARYIG